MRYIGFCLGGAASSVIVAMMLLQGVASASSITDSADLFDLNDLHRLGGGSGGGGDEGEAPSGPVQWDDVSGKPQTAVRWPTWNEIQEKPDFYSMFLQVDRAPVGISCPENQYMTGIDSDGGVVCATVTASGGDGGGGDSGGGSPPPDDGTGGPHGNDGNTYHSGYEIGTGGCGAAPDYGTPVGGIARASFVAPGTYTYEVTDALKDKEFTIVLKGAGGGSIDNYSGCGGNGGGIVFNYSPGVSGQFDVLVGQGGRSGPSIGGGAKWAGGASAIKFNDELLAIVGGGGGGSQNGMSPLGTNGGDGGSFNLAGGRAASSSTGGYGGGGSIGGAGNGFMGYNGSNGGSYGNDGDGPSGRRGAGVAEFSISGGGAGRDVSKSKYDTGGGGGGYGGGGGGGEGPTDNGGGGGGGGYYSVYNPSTPMVIKGARGNRNTTGDDGVALIYTDVIEW